MIHYHGALADKSGPRVLISKHALVPFTTPKLLSYVSRTCQSFVLDNGAFSKWRSGKPTKDWHEYYEWVEQWSTHPGFDWAAIPDVIGGTEDDNRKLLRQWPLGPIIGTPVFHMHESLKYLSYLADNYRTVAIGSSGAFAQPGTAGWWARMDEIMRCLCTKDWRPRCRVHGMRMLNKDVFTRLPLASADSVNVARNMHMVLKRKFARHAPHEYRARTILEKNIEPYNSAERYTPVRFTNGHLFK